MVQTRDQYVFCHTALLHFVRSLAAEAQAQAAGGGGASAASPMDASPAAVGPLPAGH